ncbi:glycosyltransferase family 2 protein [Microbacterium sp. A204]|uniref:glycosyltransferase family 2 protein n=1 Tax=Microbacterium sp. A204 TaxID=3457321 RepID=UPI003FD2328A
MGTGTIDIIMPFFGDPGQFKEAVRSVIAQTDSDWRLVVLDDCYPHWNPEDWIQELGDPRIALERNPQNLGVSKTFDRSIDLAKSDYVAIPGCDDRLLPNYISEVRALIERFNKPEYVQPAVSVIDDDGQPSSPLPDRIKAMVRPRISGPTLLSGDALLTTLMHGNWTYFPAICWRTDVLRRFRFTDRYEIVMDLALQTDILLAGGRLATSTSSAFEYRRHSASASSYTASDGTRFIEERDYYRGVASQLRAAGQRRAARAATLRVTSRLNALSKLPAAMLHGRWSATSLLWKHVFAR